MTRPEAVALVASSRWVSTCCTSYPLGDEVSTECCDNGQAVGLCSDCRDHAMFVKEAMLDDDVAALVDGEALSAHDATLAEEMEELCA